MIGNDNLNQICGKEGNDRIDLRGNPSQEFGAGRSGDDIVNGGTGDDLLVGDIAAIGGGCSGAGTGSDRLIGGPGDDFLLHGNGGSGKDEGSDGHRDYVDCGPGNDFAVINTSVDGDVAVNCDVVDAG